MKHSIIKSTVTIIVRPEPKKNMSRKGSSMIEKIGSFDFWMQQKLEVTKKAPMDLLISKLIRPCHLA